MIHLSKVRVCQCLLCSDPLVRVNLQHLLQQVDGHRVGSLKHDLEILERQVPEQCTLGKLLLLGGGNPPIPEKRIAAGGVPPAPKDVLQQRSLLGPF